MSLTYSPLRAKSFFVNTFDSDLSLKSSLMMIPGWWNNSLQSNQTGVSPPPLAKAFILHAHVMYDYSGCYGSFVIVEVSFTGILSADFHS